MAEVCKDIDAGLAALNRKIDAQNQRIRELERKQKECCDNSDNGNADLSGILKRLKKAETDILDLGGITQEIVDDLKNLLDAAIEHTETANQAQGIFSSIIDFFVDE
jgi:septal ring factor EnvC (AmiA/AmiB activator)